MKYTIIKFVDDWNNLIEFGRSIKDPNKFQIEASFSNGGHFSCFLDKDKALEIADLIKELFENS